jgi:hypothetical protein
MQAVASARQSMALLDGFLKKLLIGNFGGFMGYLAIFELYSHEGSERSPHTSKDSDAAACVSAASGDNNLPTTTISRIFEIVKRCFGIHDHVQTRNDLCNRAFFL